MHRQKALGQQLISDGLFLHGKLGFGGTEATVVIPTVLWESLEGAITLDNGHFFVCILLRGM